MDDHYVLFMDTLHKMPEDVQVQTNYENGDIILKSNNGHNLFIAVDMVYAAFGKNESK